MKLSRQEVEHIARLARLTLTEAEIVRYQEQLSDLSLIHISAPTRPY